MRRRVIAVVCAVLLCGLPLLAVASSSPAAAVNPPVEALLVGDSVMNGMAQGYGATARAELAARHSFLLDAAGCRRLIGTSCSIGGAPRPTNALTEIRGMAGRYWQTLVVAAGYNDPTYGSEGLDLAITTFLAEAHNQGVQRVVWLTYRQAGASASRFAAHNALLRQRAAADPMLVLADWSSLSASLPSSWFSGDGIHLGGPATQAMGRLIGDTLDLIDAQLGDTGCMLMRAAGPIPPTTPTSTPTKAPARPARAVAVAWRANLNCP